MFRLDLKYCSTYNCWTAARLENQCAWKCPVQSFIQNPKIRSGSKVVLFLLIGLFWLTVWLIYLVRYVTDVEGRTVNRAQTAPYVISKNTGGFKTYVMIWYGTTSAGRSINVSFTVCQLVAEYGTGKNKNAFTKSDDGTGINGQLLLLLLLLQYTGTQNGRGSD